MSTPTIPTTTELGPDARVLREQLRRVAEAESPEAPILSVYLDLRPEAHGERPAERPQLTALRDHLEELLEQHPAHSTARRSIEADRRRLERLLDGDETRALEGLAAFACDAIGLWEWAPSAEAFDMVVSAGRIADLFWLASLADADVPAIVVLTDTSSSRFFVVRRGALRERIGPEDDVEEHRRHDQGGWSQARFQRHVDEQDRRFAKRVADEIARLAGREHATAVVVCGEERATSALLGELGDRERAMLLDIVHLDMHVGRDAVEAAVLPRIRATREERAAEVAERALAGHRAGALGVLGIDPVRRMLEQGAVAELVIDTAADLDHELRAELVRQAILTDARVVIVHEHQALQSAGGIGATLRFRPTSS
jgi:peptide chain release factor subunit 1